jgi:hypothetical protein
MRVQDFHLPTHGWMDLQDSNPSSTSCSCRVLRPKSTVFMVRKELSIESPTSAAVVKELSSPHGSIPATTFSRFATAVVVDRPGAARGREHSAPVTGGLTPPLPRLVGVHGAARGPPPRGLSILSGGRASRGWVGNSGGVDWHMVDRVRAHACRGGGVRACPHFGRVSE